jgi:hypothetical protein
VTEIIKFADSIAGIIVAVGALFGGIAALIEARRKSRGRIGGRVPVKPSGAIWVWIVGALLIFVSLFLGVAYFRVERIPAESIDRFVNHTFAKGQIPNGFACQADSDCDQSDRKAVCYPGPPNNAIRYCMDATNNCALPGTSGTKFELPVRVGDRRFACNKKEARWDPID